MAPARMLLTAAVACVCFALAQNLKGLPLPGRTLSTTAVLLMVGIKWRKKAKDLC
jgi:hypothetical protein